MTACTIYEVDTGRQVEFEDEGYYFPTLAEARRFAAKIDQELIAQWKKDEARTSEDYDADDPRRPRNEKPDRCKIDRVRVADMPLRMLACHLLTGNSWIEHREEGVR
jgi:hypothetical protein